MDQAARESPPTEVIECVGVSFVDPLVNSANSSVVIHHGDKHDSRLSCHQITVDSKATEKGKVLPSPWREDGTLSVEYLVSASKLHDQGDTTGPSDARLQRVISADEDLARLHQGRVQKDCQPFDFQAMLNSSHHGGSKEKIICVLSCKAILNVVTLGNKRDLVGDCYAILTENDDPQQKFRKVYFAQIGVEYKDVKSDQQIRRAQQTIGGVAALTSTILQESEISIACSRQTVSYLAVLNVEQQVVQALCEQLDGTSLEKKISYAGRFPGPEGTAGTTLTSTEIIFNSCLYAYRCRCLPDWCFCKWNCLTGWCSCKCLKCPKCPKCPKCNFKSCKYYCTCQFCKDCCDDGGAGEISLNVHRTSVVQIPANLVMPSKKTTGLEVQAATETIPGWQLTTDHRLMTERRAGDPDFSLKNIDSEKLGEHEQIRTTVAATNYTAVYIHHTVPTNALLQETILVLSPSQPLRDAFLFVTAISRQPTQLDCWAGNAPRPPNALLQDHVDHRDQIRNLASDQVTLAVLNLDAVIGLKGLEDQQRSLVEAGEVAPEVEQPKHTAWQSPMPSGQLVYAKTDSMAGDDAGKGATRKV